MRMISCCFFLLLALAPTRSQAQIKMPDEFKVRVGRLAKLEAVSETGVKWINLHDDLDMIPDSSGKFVTLLAHKPGRFKIAAYTATKDGNATDPAYCTIVAEAVTPPTPPPPPSPKADPAAATGRIRFGNAGCTATVMYPRRADGRWDVLTAAHCVSKVGAVGSLNMKDGRSIKVSVSVRQSTADVCWLVTDDATIADLPFAILAPSTPAPGTAIWHNGYGVDKPGNTETGTVVSGPDSNGQIKMSLSVSSGDSGGGIFRTDTGELVACVCCTASMGRQGAMWGGGCEIAARLRPGQRVEQPMLLYRDDVFMEEKTLPSLMHPVEIFADTLEN